MAEKLFYSMGEVAEMFDVNQSLIRHWQTQFGSLICPERNKKGNRLFSPQDVANLKLIYHLVKERGLTLDGAKKAIRQQRVEHKGIPREVELLEHLQRIRALLVEVREDLKTTEGEVITDATTTVETAAPHRRKSVVQIVSDATETASAQAEAEAGQLRRNRARDSEPELFAAPEAQEQLLF